MAATAQDPTAPLRGPEKKDEDRDDDSKIQEFALEGGLLHFRTSSGATQRDINSFVMSLYHEDVG